MAVPSTDPYLPLFEQYRRELHELYERLVAERERVIRDLIRGEGLSREEAAEKFDENKGPLVHDGRAIHLIRKYWLEIDRLKKERMPRDENFVEPLTFLVEDLQEEDEDDLVAFLTEIAYWPIGLDEDNQWS
jgi:hypothetical protein